jgi:mannose-6-phosphate isomerase
VAGPGESVDVPQGAKHRLANEGSQELVIVEVQHGAYTGEDDIERLEDDYDR